MSEQEKKDLEAQHTFIIKKSAAEWIAVALTAIVLLVASIQYAETKPSREEVKAIVKEINEHSMEVLNLKLEKISSDVERIGKTLDKR